MANCDKITVFNSPHERCGIGEYGRGLNEAFRLMGVNVEEKSITDMSAFARAEGAILVHFEPLLAPKTFYRLGWNLKRRGMPIVACCHLFSQQLGQQLGFCHKVVVHRHYDGLPVNHAVVPLACPIYEPEERGEERAKLFRQLEVDYPELLTDGDQPTIISTCGFVSNWKKFPELVDALHPLLPENTWLQMLCSPHFSGIHGSEMDRLRQTCASKERVILETRFLPEVELLDRLALSDLGVVYHGVDTGSVSAATKAMVSARVPFVTTNSSHASDITCAYRASGEIGQFARSTMEILKDFARLRELRAETQREYERINMIEVAGRYLDIFEGLA